MSDTEAPKNSPLLAPLCLNDCGMVEHGGACPPPDPSRWPVSWKTEGRHWTTPDVHKRGRMVGIEPEARV